MIAGVNFFVNFVNLIIGMYLVRQFTPESYGQYTYLLTRFGLFRLLATFGMGSVITFHIAQSLKIKDAQDLNQKYYSFLMIRLSIFVIIVSICSILAFLLDDHSYFLIMILLLPASIGDFNLATLQGNFITLPISFSLLAQPISFAIFAFSIVHTTPTLSSLYFALILSFFFYLVISTIFVWKLDFGVIHRGSFNLALVKSSIPLFGDSFIIVILQFLFNSIILYLLGFWRLFSQTALLGVVLNLVIIPVGLIQVPVASVYQPRFARLFNPIDPSEARRLMADFLLFIFRLTVIAVFICFAFAPTLVSMLYGKQYLESSIPLMILSPMIIFLCMQFIITITMIIIQKPRLVIPGLLIQLLFTTLFSILVILYFSSNIVLLAVNQTLAAFLGTSILIRLIQKQLSLEWQILQYRNTILLAAFSVILVKLLISWIPANLVVNTLAIFLSGALYLILISKELFGTNLISLAVLSFQKKR